MSSAFLVPPGEGATVSALGSTYTTKTGGEQLAGAYSVMEEEFWADTTPLHRHLEAEETFYVLDGEVELWADGEVTSASAGSFLVVPRGLTHGLRRLSSTPVRMLTIVSPPGFERIFDEVARRGEQDLLEHPEELLALSARHGTEIVGDYPG